MKNFSVLSRSRLEPPFLPGAGADPSRSEPESDPGPWRPGAGAAQKSGGSATLVIPILEPVIPILEPVVPILEPFVPTCILEPVVPKVEKTLNLRT